MFIRRKALNCILYGALIVSLQIEGALASNPPASVAMEPRGFTQTLLKLYRLDSSSRSQHFDVKNKKGESIFAKAQSEINDQWAIEDPVRDKVAGTSTQTLYQKFKISADRNEVIVAVIDDGVDITHEDLKGHIWINLPEFVGKLGVDDDGDGYVDDIYGWNFLGAKNGSSVEASTLEVTRVYKALQAKMNAGQMFTATETALYNQVMAEYQDGLNAAQSSLVEYQNYDSAIRLLKANGLTSETLNGLHAVTSNDPAVLQALQIAKILYDQNQTSQEITEAIAYFKSEIDFNYNLQFDSSAIVKDDPADLKEVGYGNGDVAGPNPRHGTHVAGIIAADRVNHFGINGQGMNVKVMPLRVVPDGDERDKDVANAVRFAVDHGARIINMSFGKNYSPNKSTVDLAMKYAESMGVLIVHAAGNDGVDTGVHRDNFPNRDVESAPGQNRSIETWIEVGASTRNLDQNLPASFSNYGKTTVDLFAPGAGIVSTVPKNQYAKMSGTSMASPEVAGVAAILLEAYPFATALEVKSAILGNTNQYPVLTCNQPAPYSSDDSLNPTQVPFSDLSASGGTLNAERALIGMQTTTVR